MSGGATRRSVLATSLTAPLLAAAGCGAATATPPARRPSDVTILRDAITAKKDLIGAYTAVLAVHPGLSGQLEPLLADNTAHLAVLRRRLVEPSGQAPAPAAVPSHRSSPSPSPSSTPASPSAALTALQSAERTAAATNVAQLRTVTPSLAQLLASIAACEATHEAALAALAALAARPAQGRIR